MALKKLMFSSFAFGLKMSILLLFLIACLTLVTPEVPQRTAAIVSTPLTNTNILPKDYNRDISPTVDGNPVEVNVSLVVLSLKPELNAQMVSLINYLICSRL